MILSGEDYAKDWMHEQKQTMGILASIGKALNITGKNVNNGWEVEYQKCKWRVL